MRRKTAALTALILVIAALFAGCDALPFNAAENLIRPPMLTGSEGALQLAFDGVMADKGEYVLKYPSAGDYKSAFVRIDCDSDGDEEAFVFYSLKAEEMLVNMYILDYSDGKWQPVATMPGEGNDVYSVEFSDLNNDGMMELLVGWSSLDAKTNKKLSVYSVSPGQKTPDYRVLAIETYTSMYTTDLDLDGEKEILLALINSTPDSYTTDARLLKMSADNNEVKISPVGQCMLYSEITAVNSITSGVADGRNYVYIDETAGSSYLTEILYWDEKEDALTPAFEVDMLSIASCPTSRSLPLNCKDIDSDGEIEIPSTQLVPDSVVIKKTSPETPASPAENIYVTSWKKYNGEFATVKSYIYNNYDNFSIKYNSELMADWSFSFYPDERITQVFKVNANAQPENEPVLLFTIRALPTNTVLSIEDYLSETEEIKYSCEITQEGENAGITRSTVVASFSANQQGDIL